jgi:hypothetical protein
MSFWAIDYDLSADAMKEANYSDNDALRLREAVEGCFVEHCFTKLEGASFHASDRNAAISNAYSACLALTAIVDAEKFISRLNLFRINDLTDLLPFLHSANSSPCNQEDGMNSDSVEQSTVGFTLTAIIQDLFLDGPEHGPKRPHAPQREPTAKAS